MGVIFMNFALLFSVANTLALLGWLVLALAPRPPAILATLQFGLIGALAITYSALVFVFFFRIEGGGFGSISEIRALFQSDAALVAGWIHYLAFDLFVGIYIARESDVLGVPRVLQVPMLIATFMFGPLGLLLFYSGRAASSTQALVFGKVGQ
jgi:hypothetical protein